MHHVQALEEGKQFSQTCCALAALRGAAQSPLHWGTAEGPSAAEAWDRE